MYAQQSLQDTLFLMLYGGVAILALAIGLYLWLRRSNAIAPDVTPPMALRLWTAAFFITAALSHVWWYVLGVYWLADDRLVRNIVAVTLDHVTLVPLVMALLLHMLQDRKRPLWPWGLAQLPIVVAAVVGVIRHDEFYGFEVTTYWQIAVMIVFVIYYIHALIRYGRWLHENYADLEHKEVWQGFVVLVIMLLVFGIYTYIYEGRAYLYAMLGCLAVLIFYLLWRVETLSDLSVPLSLNLSVAGPVSVETEAEECCGLSQATCNNIGALLQRHCIETQLYLQHDLSLSQLAKAIGTNRFYLSQYFSAQGMTYNAYINDLRISHFMNLYRESVDDHRSFTAHQLAQESGFRNYNTFSSAFKRKTGQSVTAWMKAAGKS
jgi:AraC-like DNA-binding protein